MATELKGKRIAFLVTEGVEQVELTEPLEAVREAGADAELISLETGEVQAFNHLDKGDTFKVDTAVADADADGLRRARAAGRRGQPGRAARRRATRCDSSAPSSSRTSRSA